MAVSNKSVDGRPCRSATGARHYQLIFLVGFTIFLMIALVSRLLPRRWRPLPLGRQGKLSIIQEARAMADTCVPFAFMA